MSPTYEWENTDTGEVVEVQRSIADIDVPPDESGNWKRLLGIPGIGSVSGAGGSPSRTKPVRRGQAN